WRGAGAPPIHNGIDKWFFPNLNFIATKLPYVITAHDLSYEIFPEFFSTKMRLWHKAVQPKRLFQNASAILAPSASTKRDLELTYGVDAGKIHVIPLAAGSLAGAEAPAYKLPVRYLLTLGTLEPRKNHLSVIEAYEMYRDASHDPIALVIAGGRGWKSAPIVRRVKKSKYAKEIHLIDYVSEDQKLELYHRAQLFLFPSFYEGFGLPVLEAMQAGCPVITSNTSSLPEITQTAAILVDPFNVNDIATAIKLVLSSDRLRADLAKKGLARAQDFSWDATARATLEVLQKT
ncbi:MAG: glycosyltransferase family 1 protein, partial [Sedimentisphaerales bacterium]|nr:glycosyltransferase family 1 protein [Sedimentisphaerales bacterium]